LITFFKLPVYTIAGAVLLGTFASSMAGVAFYSFIPLNGTVASPDWMLGILLGAGGLLGMYFGAKVQKYIPENRIRANNFGFIWYRSPFFFYPPSPTLTDASD